MSEAATNDAYIGRLLRFCFERSPSSMLRLFRGRESCNNACTVDLVASDKEEVDIVACVDEKGVDVAIIVVDNDSTSLGYFFTVLEAILDVDAANNCMWRQLPPNIMVIIYGDLGQLRHEEIKAIIQATIFFRKFHETSYSSPTAKIISSQNGIWNNLIGVTIKFCKKHTPRKAVSQLFEGTENTFATYPRLAVELLFPVFHVICSQAVVLHHAYIRAALNHPRSRLLWAADGMEISYATSSNVDITEGDVVTGVARQVRMVALDCSTPSSPGLPTTSLIARWRTKLLIMSAVEWMEMLLPCTRWMRTYQWSEYLQVDLMAGITVGVMLVPQAMSYAKLAGLHPIYGLYSGFTPIFVYGIFGSSRQLAIGPVTLVSLLVSNVLSRIVSPKEELYTELAILLAFMVGALECAMGLLRLGWLLRFISHSVISGFITSSAIIIALSQAKYFLGYNIERSSKIVPLAKSIIAGVGNFSWPPFIMGSTILLIILLMKHLGRSKKNLRFLRASGPLTAVILGTSFVKMYHPSSIAVVGEIPQGFPRFHIPREFGYAESLISTAILITGVAILESVGIAKALAAKNGYELDSNQELFGLGIANICGSFFSAYPATGSFSRSAVNHESGAKTGLSGIITGITMGCALYFLTPLFQDIPQCALAAIVISVGISLVDYEEALFLWHVDKKDFLLWTISCIMTLFLGIEIGVLVGVGSSLAFVIHESANPHIAVLGRLPGTTVYRNIEQYPEAYVYVGIVVVRIDAPLYFANISYIKDRLRQYELVVAGPKYNGSNDERIYFVIIEMAPVPYLDSSAVQALKDLYQEYKSREIQIAISNPSRKVLQTLSRAGFIELLGKSWYFVSVHDAVKACLQEMPNLPGSIPRIGDQSPRRTHGFAQKQWRQQSGDECSLSQEPLLLQKEV